MERSKLITRLVFNLDTLLITHLTVPHDLRLPTPHSRPC
jgi:hypothetical protein